MKFYRYSYIPSKISSLQLIEYDLIKETSKGYWIGIKWGIKYDPGIWISKTSKKRFAYPTKKEALTNYIKRTERRLMILKNQMYSCELGLKESKMFINELS